MTAKFLHVRQGQPFQPSAGEWNAGLDVARAFQTQRLSGGPAPVAEKPYGNLVYVRNQSGSDVGRFSVLSYGTFKGANTNVFGPAILPTDDLTQFQKQIIINGTTPDTSSQNGQFVITLDPIVSGDIGRAFLHGACPAYVNINDGGDQFAEIKNGDLTQLDSNPDYGSARILWRDSSGTGSKWCWIMLGQPLTPGMKIGAPVVDAGGSKLLRTDSDGKLQETTATPIAPGTYTFDKTTNTTFYITVGADGVITGIGIA
jgi:hypothetical protein